jgi:colanic acid/amylovoran biosynthesis glycosyltransferase
MTVALIYTTFPKRSETFYLREAMALLAAGEQVAFYSLWGGGGEVGGVAVRRLGLRGLIIGAACALGCFIARPSAWRWLRPWGGGRMTAVNLAENLLGLCGAFAWRNELVAARWRHAQWGTAPAMTTLTIKRLSGVGYSMGLHAYDLYERGGDAYLGEKVAQASTITSSNQQAAAEVARRFPAARGELVRRGLSLKTLTPLLPRRVGAVPHLITVGRLVEKKGFGDFLEIVARLRESGVPCTAEIIGDGPCRHLLEQRIRELQLTAEVVLAGWLPSSQVAERLASADFFLFTGRVAPSGDRDGFPNVIGEAMAAGAVVLAHDVASLRDGINDGVSGVLLPSLDPELWVAAIRRLQSNTERYEQLRRGARAWVEQCFEVQKNAAQVAALWCRCVSGSALNIDK